MAYFLRCRFLVVVECARLLMFIDPKTLKPCPFCGNPDIMARFEQRPDGKYTTRGYIVFCQRCSAQVEYMVAVSQPYHEERSQREACGRWERRDDLNGFKRGIQWNIDKGKLRLDEARRRGEDLRNRFG